MSDGRKRPRTEEEKKRISERTKQVMSNQEVKNKMSPDKMKRNPWNKDKKLPGSNPHGVKRNFTSNRDMGLFYEYGIRESDYNILFEKQNGRCLGCGRHQSELSHPLHVDHDHKTGKIRGLLCKKCNSALGNTNDDIGILASLIEYLKKHL